MLPGKQSLSNLFVGPLYVLKNCYKVSLEPCLEEKLSQFVFAVEVLQPSNHLFVPPLNLQVNTKICLTKENLSDAGYLLQVE